MNFPLFLPLSPPHFSLPLRSFLSPPQNADDFIVRETASSLSCKSQGKGINFDWLADQCDERRVLGHAQVRKGKMKGDDPEIATAPNPKHLDRGLAPPGKIWKTFTKIILIKNHLSPEIGLFLFFAYS